jgi:hypothetical protein
LFREFMPVGHAKTPGSNTALVPTRREATRTRAMALGATILVTETDQTPGTTWATIAPAMAGTTLSPRQSRQLQTAQDIQAERVDPDESVTVQKCFEGGIAGSPNRVLTSSSHSSTRSGISAHPAYAQGLGQAGAA